MKEKMFYSIFISKVKHFCLSYWTACIKVHLFEKHPTLLVPCAHSKLKHYSPFYVLVILLSVSEKTTFFVRCHSVAKIAIANMLRNLFTVMSPRRLERRSALGDHASESTTILLLMFFSILSKQRIRARSSDLQCTCTVWHAKANSLRPDWNVQQCLLSCERRW